MIQLTENQQALLRAYSNNMLTTAVGDGTITDDDYDVLLHHEFIRERTDVRFDINPNPPRFTLYEITEEGRAWLKSKLAS